MKWYCSRCGKEVESNKALVKINTAYQVYKVAEQGILIPFNNLSEPTSEILCEECFTAYADCINTLNNVERADNAASMVEIIDDIQYGNECCQEG